MKFLFAILLALVCTSAFAQQDAPTKLIPVGCNFDGGLTWYAVGKATAGPEPGSFRVEVPDVDLDRVEAMISPSSMDMFMPYGLGPVVGPISVANTTIAPRQVSGVPNGNIVTIHFNILSTYSDPADFLRAGAIAYVLVLNNKYSGCKPTP
jgi:hypothetical protein